MEKIELLKYRDVGDVLQDTIKFVSQNIRTIIQIILPYGLPAVILQGIFSGLWQYKFKPLQEQMASGGITEPSEILDLLTQAFGIEYFAVLGISVLVSAVFQAVTLTYLDQYQNSLTGEVDPKSVSNVALSKIFKVIGFSILFGIIITFASMLGLIAFIIGALVVAVYLGVRFSLLMPAAVIENKSFGESMSRSTELVKDDFWNVLLSLFVVGIGGAVVGAVVSLPGSITQNYATSLVPSVIGGILSAVGSAMTAIISSVGVGFIYFGLIAKKESRTSSSLIDEIGTN